MAKFWEKLHEKPRNSRYNRSRESIAKILQFLQELKAADSKV